MKNKQKHKRLAHIIVNTAAFFHRVHNAGKIIIEQYHTGGRARHFRPAFTHRDANIRFFERRRVIHPITSHRHHLAVFLQSLHNRKFLFRTNARENIVRFDNFE